MAPERRLELRELLERAYGLTGDRLHPAGTTAVASRSHNLISTATVFCLVGLGWPEALRHSEEVFFCTDAAPGRIRPLLWLCLPRAWSGCWLSSTLRAW